MSLYVHYFLAQSFCRVFPCCRGHPAELPDGLGGDAFLARPDGIRRSIRKEGRQFPDLAADHPVELHGHVLVRQVGGVNGPPDLPGRTDR